MRVGLLRRPSAVRGERKFEIPPCHHVQDAGRRMFGVEGRSPECGRLFPCKKIDGEGGRKQQKRFV